MRRRTTLWVLWLLVGATAPCQPTVPAGGKAGEGQQAPATGALLDVLFATNEDCELTVNNESRGPVSKEAFRYVKLAPGQYRFSAKSLRTGDELNDAFTVSASGLNEVFMDLLFVVDENAARTAGMRAANRTGAQTAKKTATVVITDAMRMQQIREAQQRTVEFLTTNTAYLRGGRFVMGNSRSPARDESEHAVTIRPVYFGKYEVTQDQWESVMGNNPSLHKNCPTCPVENVSWAEVTAFVQKLNTISDKKFRLPTEAEWEYAAKAGGRAEVDKAGGQEAYIKKAAWYFSNALGRTHPVGTKAPDVSGVYDLIGNVSEWCLDWYSPSFYKETLGLNNPVGPASGKERVIRGGNYKDYVGDRFRPSFRNHRPPAGKSSELGFRLVMEPVD